MKNWYLVDNIIYCNEVAMQENIVQKQLSDLDKIVKHKKHFLIVTHNNPDPDAIASAAALSYLLEKRYEIKTSLSYSGTIGRAENLTMVKILSLHLKKFNRISLKKYDGFALVDGQPGAGNTPDIKYDLVIDHHPQRKDTKADLTVINPDIGASATFLVNWIKLSQLVFSSDLATALAYGISSETENLDREVHSDDIQAYMCVYDHANLRKLAKILNPKQPAEYFQNLYKTLQEAVSFRFMIYSGIGEINTPEIVSEMADLLLKHKHISWVFCTGKFKNSMILSIRSSNQKAKAGKIIKKLVDNPDMVGGHDTIAGGTIPLTKNNKDYQVLSDELRDKFTRIRGLKNVNWTPLIDQ